MASMLQAAEKLRAMREITRAELEHIPKGNIKQNMFRGVYQMARMNSQGGHAECSNSKEAVMKRCLELYKQQYPEFEPQYDKDFFKVTKR
jgi:hypothetical protein